ncbi:hypothetical protein H5410_033841 [Solanum commersonii]|uniref:Uncharacterized protein n=1 Tax=Solanum commersonii TaxID=4109 RepID=A0A9J5YRR6_SOLCO|nr:hypothetical protein H5410_033841 [Solanum commersonii]
MEVYQNIMEVNIMIKVVNKAKTDFWKDEWHETGKLENLRHLNDWEIQRVVDFISTIEQFKGHRQVKIPYSGKVKESNTSLHKKLAMERHLGKQNPTQSGLLYQEASLTQDNLKRRGIPLCPTHWTTMEDFLLNPKGISRTMHEKITEAMQSWEKAGVQAKNRDIWRIVHTNLEDNLEEEEC